MRRLWVRIRQRPLGKLGAGQIARRPQDWIQLAVSAISFWEITLLVAKRRFARRFRREIRDLILRQGTIELPLTGEIAVLAGELESLHGDPADRFIAATAIVHDATLVTADEKLLRWRHSVRRQNAKL